MGDLNPNNPRFNGALKVKPQSTPNTDADYGQFFPDSGDSNKPKFKKPDGTVIDLTGGGGGGAPTDAQYLVLSLNGSLSAERVLAAGTNIAIVDGGANGNATLNVPDASTTVKGAVELATNGESAASLAVQANDSRLSDARTPTAHASSHLSNGSDPIAVATTTVRGTVELATDGENAANVVVQGNDARLSDSRAPNGSAGGDLTGSSYPNPTVANNAISNAKLADMAGFTVKVKATTGSGDPSDLAIAADRVVGRTGSGDIASIQIGTAHILDDNITDAKIGTHTSTKITITAKGQLNSAILYNDVDNALGAHFLEFDEIADPSDPGPNKARLYLDNSDEHFKVVKNGGVIVDLEAVGAGGSENTSASNLGAGQGVFKQEVGDDLQFRSLTATSSKITLANNTNDIGIDVAEANLTLSNIGGSLAIGQIPADLITNAKLADMAANTIKGNNTGSTDNPVDIAVGTNTVLGRVGSNIVAAQLVDAQITTGTISLGKLADIATDSLMGRDTASSGAPENILLNSTLEMDGSGNLRRAAISGDITISAGSNTAAITSGVIVDGDINASGITTRSKLPGPTAYEDEANTFTLANEFQEDSTFKGTTSPNVPIRIDRNSSTIGAQTGIRFNLRDNGASLQTYGNVLVEIGDNVNTSEDGILIVQLAKDGTNANVLSVDKDGIVTMGRNERLILSESGQTSAHIMTFPDANSKLFGDGVDNDAGDHYLEFGDIVAPSNPSAGKIKLFMDSGTGELSVRKSGGTTVSLESGAGGGEANTASNLGAGQGVFKSKVGVDLQFRSLTATSSKISLANNTNDIGIDVAEANLTLSNLGGSLAIGQVPNDLITYAKIQNVSATSRILGRVTAGAGDIEELSLASDHEFSGSSIRLVAFTGDVTKSAGGTATTIANNAVSLAKMADMNTDKLLGRDSASSGDPEEISLSTGLEWSGSGSIRITSDVATLSGTQTFTGAKSFTFGSATGKCPIILAHSGATTTISNTVAETDMLNLSVPANSMGANGAVRFTISGYLLQNQASATTYTFAVLFGGTTMYRGSGPAIAQSATKQPFRIVGEVFNKNATNANSFSGYISNQDTGSVTTGLGGITDDEIRINGNIDSETADTTTDTTSAQTLQVTVTMDVANANAQLVVKQYFVELIP
jgi:hypothetical protein